MSGAMTSEECRAAQNACAGRVFDEMTALRREVKGDIGAIREAVQTIDRAVSAIKGYLGLNGNGAEHRDRADHPHKRDSEEMAHLHQRITDLIDAQAAPPPADWRVKVMWGLGIFAAGAIGTPILGAFGRVIAERMLK